MYKYTLIYSFIYCPDVAVKLPKIEKIANFELKNRQSVKNLTIILYKTFCLVL